MENILKVFWALLGFSIIIFSFFSLTGCDDFLKDIFTPTRNPMLDENCNIITEKFNEDWRKYSEFDPVVPPDSRGIESQKYFKVLEDLANLDLEIFELQRDYDIEQEAINSLIEYRAALIAGHKANLIKTTLRMTYLTYDAMDSIKGSGKAYADLLTSSASTGIEVLGKIVKIGRSITPSSSSIAINTKTLEGKAASVATSGIVETMASYGDPAKVAKSIVDKARRETFNSDIKLSDEELNILRKEHLELKMVDTVLQLSNKANFDRIWQIREKQAKMDKLQSDLVDMEDGEKEKIKEALIAECKKDFNK
jgi:hypothetical protein